MSRDHSESDEDALAERIDCTEYAPVSTLPKQINRLIVLEHRIRREKPIVRRLGLEDPGQSLKYSNELQQSLPRIWTWRGLPL